MCTPINLKRGVHVGLCLKKQHGIQMQVVEADTKNCNDAIEQKNSRSAARN